MSLRWVVSSCSDHSFAQVLNDSVIHHRHSAVCRPVMLFQQGEKQQKNIHTKNQSLKRPKQCDALKCTRKYILFAGGARFIIVEQAWLLLGDFRRNGFSAIADRYS